MRIQMLAAAARYLGGFQLSAIAHRFSFHDNETIDDITEKFFNYPLNSSTNVPYSTIVNGKLTAGDITYGTILGNDFAPEANSPFSVSCKFNLSEIDISYKAAIMARWHETVDNERCWAVFVFENGRVQFAISSDGTNATYFAVTSPAGAVNLNQEHHIAVERDENNLISIYVDGAVVVTAFDSRGAYRQSSALFGMRRGCVGTLTDIRLERQVVFGRPFVGNVPAKFGKIGAYQGEYYSEEEAADIVYQMTGRRSSSVNEVNGATMALTKSNIYNGRLYVANDASALYLAPVGYFGAADFTIECNFIQESAASGEGILLMSNWYNGGISNNDNRWIITVLPNGGIQFVFSRSGTALDYPSAVCPAGTIVQGRRYHIVVERFNGVIKLFVNGVVKATMNFATPLWGTSGNFIRNTYAGAGHGQHRIWDMRIAKRAMYKHVSPKYLGGFPKMPVDWRAAKPTHQLVVGSNDIANGTVIYKGFAKNFQYAASIVSFGELPHELYYNTVTGKVMRIVALFYQTNGYVVMALKESSQPRTPEMPTMTNRITVAGGQTFDFSARPALGDSKDPSVVAKHFGLNNVGNLGTAFATDETSVSFSFV